MRTTAILTGIVAATLLGASVIAQDWPQWRGANRDAHVSDFKAPATWPKELAPKWSVKVGSGGDSSIALVGDRLYVSARQGEEEVISCLNAADGSTIWTDKYAAPSFGGPDWKGHGGPRSTPAVAEGKVVTLGVLGVVSCLNAADGKVLWRKDSVKDGYTLPRFHTSSSPLIIDNMAIVQLGGGGSGAVVAYDLASGDQKWKATGDGAGYASPAIVDANGTKLVVALTDKSIEALKLSDGSQVWKADFAPQGMSYNSVSPVVDGPVVIYTGSGRGTRAVKFEKNGDTIAAKELWSNPDVAAAFCTPVLHDGLLFGLSAGSGRGGGNATFYCLDAKTGKTDWTDSKPRSTNYAAMVDAGSVIVALTSAGQLTFLEPSDKECKELASIKISDKPTFSFPVVTGNRIYVRDDEKLAMYVLE